MPLELVTIRCLQDNYAYLVHDAASGGTAVIDVPDAGPIRAELAARGWRLDHILLTHHHDDHIQGVDALRAATGARVLGAAADAHRLPALDRAVAPGDRIDLLGETMVILDVPGHTVGHIAFHVPHSALLFSADSLMAAGCGRLFEGTPDQMWQTLVQLMELPDATIVCSGHDYLDGNLRFAAHVDGANPAVAARIARVAEIRAAGGQPMPWTLAEEKASNPFLRAGDPDFKAARGMATASDAAHFADLRAMKDRF